MRDKPVTLPVPVIEIEGVEVVALEIRKYNGDDCLFTSDGKLIANQIADSSFPWIYKDDKDKRKTEQAHRFTVKVDDDLVRRGRPV